MRWTFMPPPAEEVGALGKALGTSPVLAELLWRLGMTEIDEATRFLRPTLAELSDPYLVPNLERAANRLHAAIEAREAVVVLGDYDVDGVTSTALLVSVLRRFGLSPHYVVPRRREDGYGLSRSAIDRALEAGRPGLFIALDCGTNSHEEIAYLESCGIDVLIVDHHRSKEDETPVKSGILINPHVHSCAGDDSWRNLCTVGLVFKLAHGLLKRMRADNHPVAFRIKLRDYLDLAAMGTVADLVPLRGGESHHGAVWPAHLARRRAAGSAGAHAGGRCEAGAGHQSGGRVVSARAADQREWSVGGCGDLGRFDVERGRAVLL